MPLTVVSGPSRTEDPNRGARKQTMQSNLSSLHSLPECLPDAVRLYLDHTEEGLSLRALARRDGRHASTVMRLLRRYENRRDDPLMDEALTALSRWAVGAALDPVRKDSPMSAPIRAQSLTVDEATILQEGRRILRRLAEAGAVLAIAPDMEKAVVMRDMPDGRTARTAIMERTVAQAFALKDWIVCRKAGRVASYEITGVGRAALKRMMGGDGGGSSGAAGGLAEAGAVFAGQHRDWDEGAKRIRYNLAESPIALMGRRRDKDGRLFLEPDLVEAAERLREDFELAQMGPRGAQNWERVERGGRGTAWHWRCAIWDRVLAMWRCGSAAFWRASRQPSAGWDGRRGRARSCCGSPCSGCGGITTRPTAGRGLCSARGGLGGG